MALEPFSSVVWTWWFMGQLPCQDTWWSKIHMLVGGAEHIKQEIQSIGMFWYGLRNTYLCSFVCLSGKSHKKVNFSLLSLDVVLAFGFAIGNFYSTQFRSQRIYGISENKCFFKHQYLDGDGMRHLSLGALWLSTITTSKFAPTSSLCWSPYSSYL